MRINKQNRTSSQAGFTIVELTIAVAFLGILMLVLLLSSMQMISIYNKGITLKRVNQSGRLVGEEIQATLRSTETKSSNPVITINDASGKLQRFCTGTYSFIFNISDSATPLNYQGTSDPIGFAKVADRDRAYCTSNQTGVPPRQEIGGTSYSGAVELLSDGISLKEAPTLEFTGDGKLLTFTYTLATAESTDEFLRDGRCKGGKGDEFCALNTFIVTSYAAGVL